MNKGAAVEGQLLFASGAVKDFHVSKGHVNACVEDTFSVSIAIREIPSQQWEELYSYVIEEPFVATHLLAGELPEEMSKLLERVNIQTDLDISNDVRAVCTCGYGEVFCEHVMAVLFFLAEKKDSDPLCILVAKGFDKEQLLARLMVAWTGDKESTFRLDNGLDHQVKEQPRPFHEEMRGTESTIVSPSVEVGYAALRKAFEQGKFWSAGEYFSSIPIQLKQEVVSSDSLPLTFGTPAFVGKQGDAVTAYLCSVMREVTEKAQQKIEEGHVTDQE